jgi:hypothetical protein
MLLRMADAMTYQNIDLSFWDILYMPVRANASTHAHTHNFVRSSTMREEHFLNVFNQIKVKSKVVPVLN